MARKGRILVGFPFIRGINSSNSIVPLSSASKRSKRRVYHSSLVRGSFWAASRAAKTSSGVSEPSIWRAAITVSTPPGNDAVSPTLTPQCHSLTQGWSTGACWGTAWREKRHACPCWRGFGPMRGRRCEMGPAQCQFWRRQCPRSHQSSRFRCDRRGPFL